MATILKRVRHRWTQEPTAGAAITPGHLVEFSAVSTVQVHSSAGGDVNGFYIALEDQAQGKSTTDAYASGDVVLVQAMQRGEVAVGIASAAIAANASVESAGDGRVRTLAAGTAVGRALQAAAGADSRLEIEFY